MKKSLRLYITGTVQGIFFRQFIKENADQNGVRGYIRNLEDGRVEIFLEKSNFLSVPLNMLLSSYL